MRTIDIASHKCKANSGTILLNHLVNGMATIASMVQNRALVNHFFISQSGVKLDMNDYAYIINELTMLKFSRHLLVSCDKHPAEFINIPCNN